MRWRHLAIVAVSALIVGCQQQAIQDILTNRSATVDVRSSIVRPTGINQLLTDSQADSETFDLQVSLAGVAWDREILRWDEIQPQHLNYQWAQADALFAKARKANVELLPVLTNCASWARRDIFKPVEQKTIQVPNEVHWRNFIRGAVERYKSQTSIWEIWNRPDDYKQFAGTAEDYVGMLQTAYQEARRTDPDCLVLMGSVADPNWLDSALTFGAGKYCDIIAIQVEGFVPEQWKLALIDEQLEKEENGEEPAETVEATALAPFDETAALANFKTQLDRFRTALNQHNIDKPIWITSVGLHPAPAIPQASFLCKLYATALANNVDCVFWDRLTSKTNSNVAAGLLYPDLTVRPAGDAYATVAEMLDDAISAGKAQAPEGDGITIYEFTALTERVFVAWADTQGVISLPRGCKQVFDMFGKEVKLTDEQKAGGKIKIGTQPVYITAGFVKPEPAQKKQRPTSENPKIKDNSF